MKKDTERNKIDPTKAAELNACTKFRTKIGGMPGPIMARNEIYGANSDLTEAIHTVLEYADEIKLRAFDLAKDSMRIKSSSREGLEQIESAGKLSATYLQVAEALNALQDACTIHRDGEYLPTNKFLT